MTREEIRRNFDRLYNQSELVDICTGLYDDDKPVGLAVYRERHKKLAQVFELLITTLGMSLAETPTSDLVDNPASLTNEELATLAKKASKSVEDAFTVTHVINNVLVKRFHAERESGELDLTYWENILRQSGEWATGIRSAVIREVMQKEKRALVSSNTPLG